MVPQLREALFTLLSAESPATEIQARIDEIARVAVTPEELDPARKRLIALRAGETQSEAARELEKAIISLGPIVTELGISNPWPLPPTPALLAATRQNSNLEAWLAALPSISRFAPDSK